MNQQEVIERTVAYVRGLLDGEGSGHDWWHIYRVWQLSLSLGKEEKADLFVVQLGALLHDIADWKFHADEKQGENVAKQWLMTLGVEERIIEEVRHIIAEISFKGAGVENGMMTIEGRVVQDADRLDALGAMGIARCFTYGGYTKRVMHDPEMRPVMHSTFEEYKKSEGTTINHFYEKLLLLKERMNTVTGKRMADDRHRFMEEYLTRFFNEWDGER